MVYPPRSIMLCNAAPGDVYLAYTVMLPLRLMHVVSQIAIGAYN